METEMHFALLKSSCSKILRLCPAMLKGFFISNERLRTSKGIGISVEGQIGIKNGSVVVKLKALNLWLVPIEFRFRNFYVEKAGTQLVFSGSSSLTVNPLAQSECELEFSGNTEGRNLIGEKAATTCVFSVCCCGKIQERREGSPTTPVVIL